MQQYFKKTLTFLILIFIGIFSVSAAISVDSVSLNKSEMTIDAGKSETLKAIIAPSNATVKTITWSSSDTSVATVSSKGVVKGVGAGLATITATTKDGGFTATCSVTVNQPVKTISLNKKTTIINAGADETLIATVGPDTATDKRVIWSSSNEAVATVDGNGKVSGIGRGRATITALTLSGNKKAKCSVTVNMPASSVSLDKSEMTIDAGKSEKLIATVGPQTATVKKVSWSSNDATVAIVSSGGVVKGVGKGTTTITATTTDGGLNSTCEVKVNQPVKSISLNNRKLKINAGSSETLIATVGPDGATDKSVSWSSNNVAVATVDGTGKVTGICKGTSVITAATVSGNKKASCAVTVNAEISDDVIIIEGILTSTGYYDFTGNTPVGEGRFRLDNITTIGAQGESFSAQYPVSVSDLGKKAVVTYTMDPQVGYKVKSVTVQQYTELDFNHIQLRGYNSNTPYQLTYVVVDLDKRLNLSRDCKFIENNEFIYANTDSDDKSDDFYPSYSRAWLPMTYKFIDNNKDGKYDFAIRTCYGFAEVVAKISYRFAVEGIAGMNRKDSDGNEYEWSKTLLNIEQDDYVLYTCDGAINKGKLPNYYTGEAYALPNSQSDLYNLTHNASFTEITKKRGKINLLMDYDKVRFDNNSKIYRVMLGADVDNLAGSNGYITADLNDEFEYYPIDIFGMIAKAEVIPAYRDKGEYLLIKGYTPKQPGSNVFHIIAINEQGQEVEYEVVYSESYGNINNTGYIDEYENKYGLTDERVRTRQSELFKAIKNSRGQIILLKEFSNDNFNEQVEDVAYSDYYDATVGLLVTNTSAYFVKGTTVIFLNDVTSETCRVYKGGFPNICNSTQTEVYANIIYSTAYEQNSGTKNLNALYIVVYR